MNSSWVSKQVFLGLVQAGELEIGKQVFLRLVQGIGKQVACRAVGVVGCQQVVCLASLRPQHY